jgi:hypothetical protein
MGTGTKGFEMIPQAAVAEPLRPCLRTPIPELFEAAQFLDEAATAHLAGDIRIAAALIGCADMPAIRAWTESIWGKGSPYLLRRFLGAASDSLPVAECEKMRMPNTALRKLLHQRDGYHCRFCGIPVIRPEVRNLLRKAYPTALPWGRTNLSQHAGFQAMWAQYDHLLAHARGGNNTEQNIVVACAPCNFGRMHHSLSEVGLTDPRDRAPVRSSWDGLERLLAAV